MRFSKASKQDDLNQATQQNTTNQALALSRLATYIEHNLLSNFA